MEAQPFYDQAHGALLALGDLSKTDYRKCSLIATQKIKPEEPKKPEVAPKVIKKVVKKLVKKPTKEAKSKTSTKAKPTVESTPKPVVEQPQTKKVKKTKVPSEHIQDVMKSLQAQKVNHLKVLAECTFKY